MRGIVSTIIQRIRPSQSRRLEWIHINTLLEEEVVFLECQPYFKHEVEKRWHLGDNLPSFRGISLEMNQVFGNILRNAAEAMFEREENRLTIRSWYDACGIHVNIRDTGSGIPPRLLGQIFQPFFSKKGGASEIMGSMGMGIGLYYSKELVRKYGGSIAAFNSPGAGANFVVHLPVGMSCTDEE